MSTETDTTAKETRSPYTSVPLVARKEFEDVAPISAEEDQFADNSSSLRGARLRSQKGTNKKRDGLPSWVLATGGSLANKAVNLTIDNAGDALSSLRDTVRQVSTVLATGAIGVSIAGFAFQSAFVGAELGGDVRRAAAARRAVGETLEEGGEAAAKGAARTVTETTTETAAKNLARPAAESVARVATEEVAEVASRGLFRRALRGLGFFAKRIPGIGAIVTAGFVAHEVYSLRGNEELQRAALTAGFAEVAGNVVGFGAGDAAREGVRSAFIAAGGDQYEALLKSDIRSLSEAGIDLVSEFNNAAPGAQALTAAPTARFVQQFAPAMG